MDFLPCDERVPSRSVPCHTAQSSSSGPPFFLLMCRLLRQPHSSFMLAEASFRLGLRQATSNLSVSLSSRRRTRPCQWLAAWSGLATVDTLPLAVWDTRRAVASPACSGTRAFVTRVVAASAAISLTTSRACGACGRQRRPDISCSRTVVGGAVRTPTI